MPEKETKNSKVDEKSSIIAFDHLLVRDKTTDEILVNKRDIKGGNKCLVK